VRVVTKEVSALTYTAHRLDYFSNGQAVEYVLGESWAWDGVPENDPTDYAVSYARAFRYDGARQRYMNSVIDPNTMRVVSTTWSDYDGDEVYGDFTLTGGNAPPNEIRSFELGLAATDDPLGTPTTEYFHANLIGTTRQMSDPTGATTGPAVYTAFGEQISGTNHRYGYAGAWGYQTDDTPAPAFPFLHVGHRYYDPATGRFLQRDPIGIGGGTNVYAYVENRASSEVDPMGLQRHSHRGPGGRFARKPWWNRGLRGIGKRVPIYLCGSLLARLGHRIAGKPYEDPFGIVVDIVGDVATTAILDAKDEKTRRENPHVFPPDPPRPDPNLCFVRGTLVWTPEGPRAIEELRCGDTVLSWDLLSGSIVEAQVTEVLRGHEQQIFHVQVHGEAIKCSWEHPFFIPGEGWVRAVDLRDGMGILTSDSSISPIVDVYCEQAAVRIRTYNLTVEPTHNFMIGKRGLVVHNREFLK
jgi:RHS repeat-associated protein